MGKIWFVVDLVERSDRELGLGTRTDKSQLRHSCYLADRSKIQDPSSAPICDIGVRGPKELPVTSSSQIHGADRQSRSFPVRKSPMPPPAPTSREAERRPQWGALHKGTGAGPASLPLLRQAPVYPDSRTRR
uniref:Uncharacterized protein n=1 Tax=Knipowitschia caucasica TaxID=637954 RepID=A0AAV2JYR8_KNICA